MFPAGREWPSSSRAAGSSGSRRRSAQCRFAGRTEIAAFHRTEDVDDAVNVVVIDDRQVVAARDGADVAQNFRRAVAREVMGMFCRSCSELMRYCGVCVTTL